MLVNDANWYGFTTPQWPNLSPPLTAWQRLGRQTPLNASKQAPGDEAQQRKPQPSDDHPFVGRGHTQ